MHSFVQSRVARCVQNLKEPTGASDVAASRPSDESTITTNTSSTGTLTTYTRIDNPDAQQDFEVQIHTGKTESKEEEDHQVQDVTATTTTNDTADNDDDDDQGSSEELLGTHVSFSEADKCSCHDSSEEDDDEEREAPENSQDALMAAIAAATSGSKDGATSTHAPRVQQVVPSADQVKTASSTEQPRLVAADLFKNIDDHLSQNQKQSYQEQQQQQQAQRQKSSSNNVDTKFLDEMERIFFFTDVVDRSPPPPTMTASTISSSSAMVSQSRSGLCSATDMLAPLWKIPEVVGSKIYNSSLEAYQEVEKTCKEMERTLLFTDVPDGRSKPVQGLQQSVEDQSDSGSDIAIATQGGDTLALSANNSIEETNPTGLPPGANRIPKTRTTSTLTGTAEVVASRSILSNDSNSSLKASSVAPDGELSRVLKNLERNLLFTDLPDVPTRTQSNDNYMYQSPTGSSYSTLGMCQPQVLQRNLFSTDDDGVGRCNADRNGNPTSQSYCMMSQAVLHDEKTPSSADLHRRLEQLMEEARLAQGQPKTKQVVLEHAIDPATLAATVVSASNASEAFTDKATSGALFVWSKDDETTIASQPTISSLVVPEKLDVVPEDAKSSASTLAYSDDIMSNDAVDKGSSDLFSIQDYDTSLLGASTDPECNELNNAAIAPKAGFRSIRAFSSDEKSDTEVRFLVRVKVNESKSNLSGGPPGVENATFASYCTFSEEINHDLAVAQILAEPTSSESISPPQIHGSGDVGTSEVPQADSDETELVGCSKKPSAEQAKEANDSPAHASPQEEGIKDVDSDQQLQQTNQSLEANEEEANNTPEFVSDRPLQSEQEEAVSTPVPVLEDEEDQEDSAVPVSIASRGVSWTSQDDENLDKIMDSTASDTMTVTQSGEDDLAVAEEQSFARSVEVPQTAEDNSTWCDKSFITAADYNGDFGAEQMSVDVFHESLEDEEVDESEVDDEDETVGSDSPASQGMKVSASRIAGGGFDGLGAEISDQHETDDCEAAIERRDPPTFRGLKISASYIASGGFDALLAEMDQLETSIDTDLERAQSVLRSPLHKQSVANFT